jgi:hypothetical protein
VSDNDEAGTVRWRITGNFSRSMEQQVGHSGIVTHWVAISEGLMVLDGDCSGQFQLSWDHFRSEVTFADKVRDNVDVWRFHHSQHFPQARLFFPKSAVYLREYAPASDLIRMNKSRRARVRVYG